MSSRSENEKQKLIQDKCQVILNNLLREEDNKYCVDCDAKGPRWASWNLGIFLCIRCAGIHRNLGVHISKVKSVNLDTWTPEQVACLQQMGNSQARAVYEANLPDSFRRPQTDSSLEAFVRAKYEQKKYIAKEWVPPPAPKPAFDIEEEKRKEKEKRKQNNLLRNKITTGVEIPALLQHPTALPRPHSAGPQSPSPKVGPQDIPKASLPSSGKDLLNLGDEGKAENDDNFFDAFLSAPLQSSSEKALNAVSNETSFSEGNKLSEEMNLFSQQTTGDSSQANKMTNESILSLYGSNACHLPPNQPIPPVYGVPGGVYVRPQAYSQVGLSNYPTVSIPGIAVNNPANVSAVYNPFASLNPAPTMNDQRAQPNMWVGAASDESLLMAQSLGHVQQQMVNLQISGQAWNVAQVSSSGMVIGSGQSAPGVVWSTPAHGQSLSNNLWQ